jgi:hypothetical protein
VLWVANGCGIVEQMGILGREGHFGDVECKLGRTVSVRSID